MLLDQISMCCSRCGARDHGYEHCTHLNDGSLSEAPAPSSKPDERPKEQVPVRNPTGSLNQIDFLKLTENRLPVAQIAALKVIPFARRSLQAVDGGRKVSRPLAPGQWALFHNRPPI